MARKDYPSDVSDDEWALCGALCDFDDARSATAPQRHYDVREVFDVLRWMVGSGSPWRYLPGNFPRWEVVYQQTQRRLKAGVFEAMVHDLRLSLRALDGRIPHRAQPSSIVAF